MTARSLVPPLALCLLLSGCAAVTTPGVTAAPPPSPTVAPTTPAPAPSVPIVSAEVTPPAVLAEPTRVVVPSSGIDMPVVPVGVESDGTMELPVDPAVAGWYRFGPAPASATGSVVLSAHIDAPEYPIGPLAALSSLPAGTVVEVVDSAGATTRYAIQTVTDYPKQALPIDTLFDRAGARTLVLITCGGRFDENTGHYDDNVVAVASVVP